MNNAQKIQKLRDQMVSQGVQGYIVPRTDEYQGEYVADYAERLAWLTGFTGSAGMAVILADKAMVMSDGRYTIQLADQVDGDLYALENSQEVKVEDWIQENANQASVISFHPKLFTPSQIEKLEKADIRLKPIDENLIDKIWNDQPEPPKGEVFLFDEKYAGLSAAQKIQDVQAQLEVEGADAVVITLPDSIAWLLNIRGSDIPFIPVALSYLIVPVEGQTQWFIDPDKITDDLGLSDLVEFKNPDALENVLLNLEGKVWLDTKRSSLWFKNKLSDILEKDDPCILPRSCKNDAEQKAMKNAHIRDGVALVKFLKWFEKTNEAQTEISIEKQLEKFRAEHKEFKEPSFSTIAGVAGNGAIVHYRASEKTSKTVEGDTLLLLDSGAQYEDGTTDITRTLPVGQPSDEMKENFTHVLRAHIALATAVFKKGTTGKELDEITRAPLIEKGLNYSHGTGHGVGCYLSVHEEAANISPKGEQALQTGMILSNEPGYYKEGEYGIRIENLILTKENQAGDLYFETITFVPIDKRLIVPELLSQKETKWLNDYHAKVYEIISQQVDDATREWLKTTTAKI